MPTLVLLRHAKAESHRLDDHSRTLAERGRADAADVQRWFLAQQLVPALAIVSTATRTRETWALADPGTPVTRYDDRVYEASTKDLREVIAEVTGDSLVIVGHNPGVERLAWELEENDQTLQGLRTSGRAVFDVSDWDLTDASMRTFA